MTDVAPLSPEELAEARKRHVPGGWNVKCGCGVVLRGFSTREEGETALRMLMEKCNLAGVCQYSAPPEQTRAIETVDDGKGPNRDR